jgi:hypothetical protein
LMIWSSFGNWAQDSQLCSCKDFGMIRVYALSWYCRSWCTSVHASLHDMFVVLEQHGSVLIVHRFLGNYGLEFASRVPTLLEPEPSLLFIEIFSVLKCVWKPQVPCNLLIWLLPILCSLKNLIYMRACHHPSFNFGIPLFFFLQYPSWRMNWTNLSPCCKSSNIKWLLIKSSKLS